MKILRVLGTLFLSLTVTCKIYAEHTDNILLKSKDMTAKLLHFQMLDPDVRVDKVTSQFINIVRRHFKSGAFGLTIGTDEAKCDLILRAHPCKIDLLQQHCTGGWSASLKKIYTKGYTITFTNLEA